MSIYLVKQLVMIGVLVSLHNMPAQAVMLLLASSVLSQILILRYLPLSNVREWIQPMANELIASLTVLSYFAMLLIKPE